MTTALFHETGNFRPVTHELTSFDLPITGQLPEGLHGMFVRNGPNATVNPTAHWFMGDGMVHGVRLQDGRARWYRNRAVRTHRLAGAPAIRSDGSRDLTAGLANTNVIRHAGRILALEESSLPYELTPELDTGGPFDFSGALSRPMTAHPKICPLTGELHFIGYDFAPPYLTYHVADANGRLTSQRVVDIPAAVMMHDFCLTEHYVVFLDLPAVFDLDLALQGTMPFRFDPPHGARLGILRRDDPQSAVVWVDIEPCYVFHVLNAHDDNDTITIDAVRHNTLWFGGDAQPGTLWRWTIDLSRRQASDRQLDDQLCEFPRIDDRQIGLHAQHGWTSAMPDRGGCTRGRITVIELDTEKTTTHRFDAGHEPGEAVFAPQDEQPGGQGWLLAFVYSRATDKSDLVVLDANHADAEPVAIIHLPARVPHGFHGTWMPDLTGSD